MLQLQTAYSQVQKTMKQHGLPQEVIDMIFRDVYKYNNDSIFYHLSSLASIWWEPSYRLRELCGERGALQPRYYDYWKLFPAFISLSTAFEMVSDSIDEYKEDQIDFDEMACQTEGPCPCCKHFRYPCVSKVEFSAATGWSFLERPNTSIIHLWDIEDEPYYRGIEQPDDYEYHYEYGRDYERGYEYDSDGAY